jgi:hypothetical protein
VVPKGLDDGNWIETAVNIPVVISAKVDEIPRLVIGSIMVKVSEFYRVTFDPADGAAPNRVVLIGDGMSAISARLFSWCGRLTGEGRSRPPATILANNGSKRLIGSGDLVAPPDLPTGLF